MLKFLPNRPHLVVFPWCRHQERALGKTRHWADKVRAPGDDCRMWMMDGKAARCLRETSQRGGKKKNPNAGRRNNKREAWRGTVMSYLCLLAGFIYRCGRPALKSAFMTLFCTEASHASVLRGLIEWRQLSEAFASAHLSRMGCDESQAKRSR